MKSKQTREAAKAIVSPFFAVTNAMLKGGEMVLDSMQAMARNAKNVRVAVLPDAEAPAPRKRSKKKLQAGASRAKAKRGKRR